MSSVRRPKGAASWQSQQISHSDDPQPVKASSKSSKSHSWWWDSHNIPKNSKWLEENLSDMDVKVKAMLKLIEEDADSFAKRAEMYYKKRPELVSLVEDFYRAYRALAERYDQLTGQIRQHMPQELSYDASSNSPGSSGGSRQHRAAGFSVFLSPGTPSRNQESEDTSNRNDEDDDGEVQHSADDSLGSSSYSSSSSTKSKPRRRRHRAHSVEYGGEAITRLREENQQLRLDLEKSAIDQSGMQQHLIDLQSNLSVLHYEHSSCFSQASSLRLEIEQMQTTIGCLKNELGASSHKLERVQGELVHSHAEYRALSERLAKREEELELDTDNKRLSDELFESEKVVDLLRKNASSLIQEKESLSNEVSSTLSQIRELRNEVQRLQVLRTTETGSQDLENRIACLQAQLSALQGEKGKLIDEQNETQDIIKNLQEALSAMESQKVKVEEALSATQERFDEEAYKRAQEKQRLELLVEELRGGQERRGIELQESLEKRLFALQEQLREAKQEASQLSDSKEQLEQQLEEREVHLLDVQKRFDSEVLSLAQEKLSLEEFVKDFRTTLIVLEGEKDRGIELQDVLERRLLELQEQLKEAQQRNLLFLDEKQKLETQVQPLQTLITDLQRELQATREQIGQFKSLISMSEESLETFQKDMASMQEQLQKEISRSAALEQELQSAQEQLNQTKKALTSTELHMKGIEVSRHTVDNELSTTKERLNKEIHIQNQLAEQVRELEAVLAGLQGEKETWAELHVVLEKQISAFQEQLKEANEEIIALTNVKHNFEQQVQILEVEIAALVGERSRGMDLQGVLEKRLRELQEQLQLANGMTGALEEAKHQLAGELEQLQVSIAELKGELEDALFQRKVLEDMVRDLEGQLQQTREAAAKREDEFSVRLGQQEEASSQEITKLEADMLNLQSQKSSLAFELQDSLDQCSKLKDEVERLHVLIERMSSDKAAVEEERKTLSCNFEALMSEKVLLAEKQFSNIEEINILAEEVRTLVAQLEERTHGISSLDAELKRANRALADLQQENATHLEACAEETAMFRSMIDKFENELLSKCGLVDRLRVEKRGLEGTLLDTTEQKEKFEREVHDFKNFLQKISAELTEKSEKIEILEQEVSKSQDSWASSVEEEKRLRIEAIGLQEALRAMEKEREAASLRCQEHTKEFHSKEGDLERQILKLNDEAGVLQEECHDLAARLEEKMKCYEAVEASLQELEQAFSDMKLERDAIQANCDTVMRELADKCEHLKQVERTCENLNMEVCNLSTEIGCVQKELQQMQEENELLNGRIEAAMQQHGQHILQVDSLSRAVQTAHQENVNFLDDLQWNIKSKHSSLRTLEEGFLHLFAINAKSKQDASAHYARIQELEQELETTRTDFKCLNSNHKATVKDMESLLLKIVQLEQQILSLEEEKEKFYGQLMLAIKQHDEVSSVLQREKKELSEKLTVEGGYVLRLQEESKATREEILNHKKFLEDANTQIQKLLAEIQEVRQALMEKEQEEHSVREELEWSKTKLTETESKLNQKLSSLQEEVSLKTVFVAKLEEKIGSLMNSLEENEQDRVALKNRLENELARNLEFEQQSFLLHEEKACLHSHIASYEDKVVKLHEELEGLTKHKEKLAAELHTTFITSSGQKEEIDNLTQQLRDAEIRITGLIEHSSAVSQKYVDAMSEVERFQARIFDMTEENTRLGQDVLAGTVSIAQMTATLSETEKKKSEFEAEICNCYMQIDELQRKNHELKHTLLSNSEDMCALREELSRLRQLHSELQAQHESMKNDGQRSLEEHELILLKLENVQNDLSFQLSENARLESEAKLAASKCQELEVSMVEQNKEKLALTVEIASTASVMSNLRSKMGSLEDEIDRLRSEVDLNYKQLEQKNEEIEQLVLEGKSLKKERSLLGGELEKKLEDYRELEAALNGLKEEHRDLRDKNAQLCEEAVAGATLIERFSQEVAQLTKEREAHIQEMAAISVENKRMQHELFLTQESEQQLRNSLKAKEDAVHHVEKEISRLMAILSSNEVEYEDKGKLEIELKELEQAVLCVREEKIVALERINDLEMVCKSLILERDKERHELGLVITELNNAVQEQLERIKSLDLGIKGKQCELVDMLAQNQRLKEELKSLEDEMGTLKERLDSLSKKNRAMEAELSSKSSLLQKLEANLKAIKDKRVQFEGETAFSLEEGENIQEEVNRLLDKMLKLSANNAEKVRILEDEIYKLQVCSLNLRDEVGSLAKREKSYVIAVRFMRAEFFCLVQRIKELKQEKSEQARAAEQSMQEEKKKGSELAASLSNVQQELALLREENNRQRTTIFDRAEEKREAIRQLCVTVEYWQERNSRLERIISSARDRIQKRMADTSQ